MEIELHFQSFWLHSCQLSLKGSGYCQPTAAGHCQCIPRPSNPNPSKKPDLDPNHWSLLTSYILKVSFILKSLENVFANKLIKNILKPIIYLKKERKSQRPSNNILLQTDTGEIPDRRSVHWHLSANKICWEQHFSLAVILFRCCQVDIKKTKQWTQHIHHSGGCDPLSDWINHSTAGQHRLAHGTTLPFTSLYEKYYTRSYKIQN